VAPDGTIYIAYGGDHLYLAAKPPGGNWGIQTVDDSPGVGRFTSLALDSQGRPHISYYDEVNKDLKYAWWDGSQWHTETVDDSPCVGNYASIALDSQDRPHILFFDQMRGMILASWTGSGWFFTSVFDPNDLSPFLHSSLALDAGDRPHVVYYPDPIYFPVKYGWYDGSNRHYEVVEPQNPTAFLHLLDLVVVARNFGAQVPQ